LTFFQARNTATLDVAPNSSQFDINNRIKNNAALIPLAAPVAPPATEPSNTGQPSNATDKLLEMLALSMLQQQQNNQHQLHPTTTTSVPGQLPLNTTTRANNPSPFPSAPPSPEKIRHRKVSLDEFCQYYDITAYLERLQSLEYEPGDDGITRLQKEDWGSGGAGFAKLAWDKVITKHRRFLTDVKAGLWD
jgi:hypothetical protein